MLDLITYIAASTPWIILGVAYRTLILPKRLKEARDKGEADGVGAGFRIAAVGMSSQIIPNAPPDATIHVKLLADEVTPHIVAALKQQWPTQRIVITSPNVCFEVEPPKKRV